MKWILNRWRIDRRAAARALAGLALLAGLLPVSPLQAQSTGPTYTVQAGDTLFGIAVQFGISLEALQAANPDVVPAALGIGQALVIPGYPDVTGALGIHALEAGESLDSLALRLGLKPETLVRLNRLVNPERLYVGQAVVVVDALDAAPAVPAGQTHVLGEGGGLLQLAAAAGQNPWAVAALNRLPHPGRAWAGQNVVVPGGEQPTRALPFPLVEIRLEHFPARQGRTFTVRAAGAAPFSARGEFAGRPLALVVEPENQAAAIVGVPRLADPDLYPLSLEVTEANGRQARWQQLVPVRPADYGLDPPLRVDPETIDPAVTGPEMEQLQQLVAPLTLQRAWDGAWALPSVGGLRSVYGSLRSYNGSAYDSFHTGTDFSGAEDRPVTAPAPGVVVFAGEWVVRGLATVIDHGWGVYSGYWHQSRLDVQPGQRVETGQIIGYQGATGRVTGPHLHWEVWVNGVPVDPLQWTETAFP